MSKKTANLPFIDKTNVYVSECLSTNDFLTQLTKKSSFFRLLAHRDNFSAAQNFFTNWIRSSRTLSFKNCRNRIHLQDFSAVWRLAKSQRSSRKKRNAHLEELCIFERHWQIRLDKWSTVNLISVLYDLWRRAKKAHFEFCLDFLAKTDLHFFVRWYDDMMIRYEEMMV